MNKVVLITGAALGIGRATAVRLASNQWNIAAIDLHFGELQQTVSDCISEGVDAEPYLCDVTKEESVEDMYSKVRERWGSIEGVVHSAGVGRYAPFLELGMEDWQRMMDVNVLGIVRITRLFLPDMIEKRRGRIVIVGSRRGLEPAHSTSAYSASKAALVGLTRGLAMEVAEFGIQVCLVAPGGTKTDFGGVKITEKDPRYLDPSVVAESIAHVLNMPQAAWIRELTLLPLEPL